MFTLTQGKSFLWSLGHLFILLRLYKYFCFNQYLTPVVTWCIYRSQYSILFPVELSCMFHYPVLQQPRYLKISGTNKKSDINFERIRVQWLLNVTMATPYHEAANVWLPGSICRGSWFWGQSPFFNNQENEVR